MDPLTCNYVPPYVRAEADVYKYPVEVEICGEFYQLPPTEMPGEQEWYRDFKKLVTRMVVSWLCSLPRDEWEVASLDRMFALTMHTGLHLMEARAIRCAAMLGAERLMEMGNGQVFRDEYPVVAAMYDVEFKRQLARLQTIVKSCPGTEIPAAGESPGTGKRRKRQRTIHFNTRRGQQPQDDGGAPHE